MKKIIASLRGNPKVVIYVISLLLIGLASSAIYWPAGLIVVGGLMWFDLFVTDLVTTLMIFTGKRSREDVRSR